MILSDSTPQHLSPLQLAEARVQLHYVIQCIAAVGAALAEPLPDESHVSLTWDPILEVFMGAPIRAATPFRVALDPITLTAGLINQQNRVFASFSLHQKTLEEVLDWHKQELSKLGVETQQIAILTYPPDFPDHPLGHGARFDGYQFIPERWELTLYYANTFYLLQDIIAEIEDATPIHIWPHHFDMAILIDVPGKKDGKSRTIGVGLSPGDENYPEPYWYVSPYPYPPTDSLPPLEGQGLWHTQQWVGAILTASQLRLDATQSQQLRTFLQSAVQASQHLLRHTNNDHHVAALL
jgi:hypothetical protein